MDYSEDRPSSSASSTASYSESSSTDFRTGNGDEEEPHVVLAHAIEERLHLGVDDQRRERRTNVGQVVNTGGRGAADSDDTSSIKEAILRRHALTELEREALRSKYRRRRAESVRAPVSLAVLEAKQRLLEMPTVAVAEDAHGKGVLHGGDATKTSHDGFFTDPPKTGTEITQLGRVRHFIPSVLRTKDTKTDLPGGGMSSSHSYVSPSLTSSSSPHGAPLVPVPDGLATDMLMHDMRRLSATKDAFHAIVYDELEDEDPSDDLSSEIGIRPGDYPPRPVRHGSVSLPTDENSLVFESHFESGNLRRAIRVFEFEYDIILRFDINTRGHTQWFFFQVRNLRAGQSYKFNVINLMKPDSLYNYGMLPLVGHYTADKQGSLAADDDHVASSELGGPSPSAKVSPHKEEKEKAKMIHWSRRGFSRVCYYQNHIRRKSGYYYTLTFTYTPQESDLDESGVAYFAHCYPYTYSDLQDYLFLLQRDPKRGSRFRRRTLCQTLAGNNVDLLTITSFASDFASMRQRKGIVVSARVHPGESNGSFMIKGLIDFLTGPSLEAKILRDNFVFKIIPMLNPDGVINGNYRCSLAGCDLNRRWKEPSRRLHPTIFYTKQMIRNFAEDRPILMFCDFHGHSRKQHVFMYGCQANIDLGQPRLAERVFPRMLWRVCPFFSFSDCHFRVQKSKESTARVVCHREYGLMNSLTMEASFCGDGELHFTQEDFEFMGSSFAQAILHYCDPDPSRVRVVLEELQEEFPLTTLSDADDNSDFGSDASDSDDTEKPGGKKSRRTKGGKKKKKRKGKQAASGSTSAKHHVVTGDGGGDSSVSMSARDKKPKKKKRKSKPTERRVGDDDDTRTKHKIELESIQDSRSAPEEHFLPPIRSPVTPPPMLHGFGRRGSAGSWKRDGSPNGESRDSSDDR